MEAQISAAFFNPQSRAPTADYLSRLHDFLSHHTHGKVLLQHVVDLQTIWPIWASARDDIRTLPNAQHHLSLLTNWALGGPSAPVSEARTGVIALPLLLILQLGQYFRYLEDQSLSHADFIARTREGGGIQGCCGGEPPALSVACAEDEAHVVRNAGVLLRILLGLGAYIEAVDDWSTSEPTVLAVRLKHEAQRGELLQKFSRVYVSAITEPRSISFVGSASSIASLYDYARSIDLPADKMDVTGKAHNPENLHLVPEFLAILKRNPQLFDFPDGSYLRVTVRSNITAMALTDDTVLEDMVTMILASCCDWYGVVSQVADDLEAAHTKSHNIILFGMNDSVPQSPFNLRRLRVSKIKTHPLMLQCQPTESIRAQAPPSFKFGDDCIAVVGVACRLPGANNLQELWDLISKGGDTHQRLPEQRIDPTASFRVSQDPSFQSRSFYANLLPDLKRFDNQLFGINAKEAAALDPQQRMLLELSYEALESSGYLTRHNRNAGDAIGCFIGNSMNEYLENTTSHAPSAYTATGTIRAILCGRVSYQYGWTAPSEVIDTACSSSLVAVNRACQAIRLGECESALAGGVSAITHLNNFLDLGKAGFLSPTGQCKPFDAAADGYCRAEGAGLVVLKKLTTAMKAGDQILGVIPSVATNQGGTSTTLTLPSLTALKDLYKTVLDRAGIHASSISYVEAHGTGTKAGDPIEMESIRAVLGSTSRATPLSIGSIKGNIGHCESAAGIAGLIKVLAMLQFKEIPPQANHQKLNLQIPDISVQNMEITRSLKAWDVPHRAALVNSYGAAGSNCALLCCEMPLSDPEAFTVTTPTTYPVILSAASETSLLAYSRALATYLKRHASKVRIQDVAFTLCQRRKRQQHCIGISANSIPDLVRSLEDVKDSSFRWPSRSTPIVLAFSGQYDDKVALPYAAYETYPSLRSYIDTCDDELISLGYESIKVAIFQVEPVRNAVLLQCSIFAVEYACARMWQDAGLQPDAIVGHSLGEIVGLAISRVLSLRDALSLVAFRARLVDTDWGNEKGRMLAIYTSLSEVKRLIERLDTMGQNLKVDVACVNATNFVVVGGSVYAMESLVSMLPNDVELKNTRYQFLSTTHAFHTALVDPLKSKLDQMARSLTFNQPEIPLETCTSRPLNSIHDWKASNHLRDTVFFDDAVKRIEQRLGPCVWFEAGLNTPIISMVRKATAHPEKHTFRAISTQPTLANCVGDSILTMWQHGHSLTNWSYLGSNAVQGRQIWLPPYQFDPHQHWIEHVDRAMEAQQKLTTYLPRETPRPSRPSRLVARKDNGGQSSTLEYEIDTVCERFKQLVTGHAVLDNALCPGSLYLECATMAVHDARGDIDARNLTFENLQFLSPLGLDTTRAVSLDLTNTPAGTDAWQFTVCSTSIEKPSVPVKHCVGNVSVVKMVHLSECERLAQGAIQHLQTSKTVERLLERRVYSLFSTVMHYAPFFKGIRNLTINDRDALATVELPEGQPGRGENPLWSRCDTVLLDSFVSVLGLLVNSSDLTADDHVAIATGIDRVHLTKASQSEIGKQWIVYATYNPKDRMQPLGDVYIFNTEEELAAVIVGVRFSIVNASSLAQSLAFANSSKAPLLQMGKEVTHIEVANAPTASTPDSPNTVAVATPESSPATDLKENISSYTGILPADIPPSVAFTELGFDSLSSISFVAELEAQYGLIVQSDDLGTLTLNDILESLGEPPTQEEQPHDQAPVLNSMPGREVETHFASLPNASEDRPEQIVGVHPRVDLMSPGGPSVSTSYNPFEALLETDRQFEEASQRRGYTAYYSSVAPLQDDLTIAYILEAFETSGCVIKTQVPGTVLPPVQAVAKHQKLVSRMWELLQQRGVVSACGTIMMRARQMPRIEPSSQLFNEMVSRFPKYLPEAKVLKLAGENLANCLQGKVDALTLLLGNEESNAILEDYYANSPMVSTMTDQLVSLVTTILRNTVQAGDTLRILEVGAGSGATTIRLAEKLEALGLRCEYMFTDISLRMVSRAKRKLAGYPWISYDVLDLEKDVSTRLRNRFDIVIGTNCVHATTSRVSTCRRLFETLKEDGTLVLSEGTRALSWFDISFGLLDGWWYAENGTQHPLQPASVWMETFKQAGFLSTSFSRGPTKEANTQQLLVACKKAHPVPIVSTLSPDIDRRDAYRVETLVYKKVDGLEIKADVYIPHVVRPAPLPIALMIHGGGFMTLSRKHVRIEQAKYLIECGFVPVSVDYRLCPEVDLVSGPITDVRDAYTWAQTKLPLLLLQYGISLNSDKIVLIGWSTGGHLALSVGWTLNDAHIKPPTAILSFYAPLDFESSDLDAHSGKSLPPPKTTQQRDWRDMHGQVLTEYTIPGAAEVSPFFGLRPGDVRSDMILSMPRSGTGLSLLLHQDSPSAEHIASISPLAQVRDGRFTIPTCIVHGRDDEVIPIRAAERFVEEAQRQGVECVLVALKQTGHLHDVHVKREDPVWMSGVEPGYRFLVDAVEKSGD